MRTYNGSGYTVEIKERSEVEEIVNDLDIHEIVKTCVSKHVDEYGDTIAEVSCETGEVSYAVRSTGGSDQEGEHYIEVYRIEQNSLPREDEEIFLEDADNYEVDTERVSWQLDEIYREA